MAPDTPRVMDAARVITAWEGGLAQAGLLPDPTLPLGRRMRALLALRAASFGPIVDAVADCPGCGMVLDVPLDLTVLLDIPAPEAKPVAVQVAGIRALLRPPSAADIAAAASAGDPARAVFEACVLTATHNDEAVPPAALPHALRVAAAEAIAAHDPLTEVTLALDCPACGTHSAIGLDAEALLTQDIAAAGPRLLAEIATLARAYGWAEASILAMPPARRRAYLALAG